MNKRISKEVCFDTINKLKDFELLENYRECKSVKKQILKLDTILQTHGISSDKKSNIINDFMLSLIPSGTKGVIRGNKFNSFIKEDLINEFENNSNFELCFEKHAKNVKTDEKPDWYILQKSTNKIIVGMNQLDLWSGGHQINRGYKYVVNNKLNNQNTKFLCVVCNDINLKSKKTKTFKLFESGFKNQTLCYRKNLIPIIRTFFC